MGESLRQPQGEYWQRVTSALSFLTRSGFTDQVALASAARALADWLAAYPAQAAVIQQLALSASYPASFSSLSAAVEQFARIGLDAALIRPPANEDDRVSAALLAILCAESLLQQDQAYAGQQRLDEAAHALRRLEPGSPLYDYLSLHLDNLRGAFAEAALEFDLAAAAYTRGYQAGDPLLRDPARFQELARRWVEIVFGGGAELVDKGHQLSLDLLRADLENVYRQAALGISRTIQSGESEAARQAVAVCVRLGLPRDRGPFELRRALEHLPLEELDVAVESLLARAGEISDPGLSAAWKLLLLSTQSARWRKSSPAAYRRAQLALKPYQRSCTDPPTLALFMSDWLLANLDRADEDAIQTTLQFFIQFYNQAVQALSGSPQYLPFRACFDGPIAAAVEWAFRGYQQRPSTAAGGLLSLLLDTLRSPQPETVPKDPQPGSLEEGLACAADRVQRLTIAVRNMPDTAAVVLQSVGEETLFVCATGRAAQSILLERAGPAYQAAARDLALALRAEVEHPTREARQRLAGLGQAAYAALPAAVRGLLAERRTLLVAPDFRSDQDGVPFELFHDGVDFLGLSRVLSRFLSLRELLRAVEPPVITLDQPKRAVCAAAPRIKGLPELVYAGMELEGIRDALDPQGWELPEVAEQDLTPQLLLDSAELSSLVHLAAHGAVHAGGEALLLPNGERLVVGQIERKPQLLRAFVFLNTCSLGQSRYLGGGVSRGIAYALVRASAPCVVANLLPVYDLSATRLGIEFYDQAGTVPVGEALRLARVYMDQDRVSPSRWATTILIGSPFHRLPGAPAEPSPPAADIVPRLLDAYTSAGATDEQRIEAYRAALLEREKNPGHARLQAALTWVDLAARVDLDSGFNPVEVERLAILARAIGHPAGEALMRLSIAQSPQENLDRRLAGLDAAIRALEPVAPLSRVWEQALQSCLAERQRLSVPKEPQFIPGPVSVNDMSDPAVQAVFTIQHALDHQNIRRHGKLGVRLPEETLAEVAWNAVVIGQQDRFAARYAQAEFAAALAEKLVGLGLLAPQARPHAARIAAGFLPFLWSTQRITHLDRELAVGQSNALRLVFESILAHWTPPETSPAFSLLAPLPAQIEARLRARQQAGLSKYARALRALTQPEGETEELSSLAGELDPIVNQLAGRSPQALADGAAWILGLLLETSLSLSTQDEVSREAAADLLRVHAGLDRHAEGWFAHYLFAGFESVRNSPLLFLDLWRAG